MKRLGGLVLFVIGIATAPGAQDFGDLIAPSSDELSEASAQGEIDAEQFRVLRDLYHLGLPFEQYWLLDEVPSLSADSTPDSDEPTWRAIRWRALQAGARLAKGKRVLVRERWQRRLEPDETDGFRTTLGARLNERWTMRGAYRRELSGMRTAVGRSLVYRGAGIIREITIGNFSTRLGLGTAYGFRSQLLNARRLQTDESWFYPVSGGGNGAAIQLAQGQERFHLLISGHRDSRTSLNTMAGALSSRRIPFNPELIWTISRISNRTTKRHQTVTGWGLHVQERHGALKWDFEMGHQRAGDSDAGAAVLETSWKDSATNLSGAAWWYSRDFVDLVSGSKSANLSITESLPDLSFEYRTRRSGQKGLMLKTVTQPHPSVELTTAGLFGAINVDSLLAQVHVECLIDKQARTSFALSYFGRFRRLQSGAGSGDENRHEPRLELFFRRAGAEFRSYIGWREQTGKAGTLRSLLQARWLPESNTALELWWQVAETSSRGIDSWYGYLQLNQQWGTYVRSAAKLSDSWLRSRSDTHRVTFALELTVTV